MRQRVSADDVSDTAGPRRTGRGVRSAKGCATRLRYLFRDTYSPRVSAVRVVVENRRGRVVWSKRVAAAQLRAVDTWYSVSWR